LYFESGLLSIVHESGFIFEFLLILFG